MSLQTAADIPLQITSENAGSERRISPSWSIGQLKAKLEAVTGIPPLSQKLTLKRPGQAALPIEAFDEETTQLVQFPLQPYAEIHVTDARPPGQRPNFTDVSKVDKYEMPVEEYEKKSDSVLAWKKANNLGRFDPAAPSLEQAKLLAYEKEIIDKGIAVGLRCRVGGIDDKIGDVRYVGEVPEIPNGAGMWVGIDFDYPLGKNDGSINGKRYFKAHSADKLPHGVFVRPDKVEVGHFPNPYDLDDLEEF